MHRVSEDNRKVWNRGIHPLAVAICAILLYLGSAGRAEAQMFGPRTLGTPFDPNRGASGAGGMLSGSERFLRENRARGAFVGTDRRSLEGFVGSQQAIGTGRVRAATESLAPPPDPSARVNRPIPDLRPGQMYYPKLVLDIETVGGDGGEGRLRVRSSEDMQRMRQRLSEVAGAPVDVLHRGDQTILRGVVDSPEIAQKLAIIASFEPHVREVVNELQVR